MNNLYKENAVTIVHTYEIEWYEFNKKDQVVGKRKEFKTITARNKFIDKLVEKDNFYKMGAYSN
jgi:hypothetical protein